MTTGKGSYVTSRPPWHQAYLAGEPDWYPMWLAGMGKMWWIVAWWRDLLVLTQGGRRYTDRELATILGRPRATICDALHTMAEVMYLFRLETVRGRNGYTRIAYLAADLMDGIKHRAQVAAQAAGKVARDMVVRLPGTTRHLKIDGEYRGPP